MSTPQHETRVRVHRLTQRCKKFAFLLLLGTVLIMLTAATANVGGSTPLAANATAAQPLVGATTHPIQYWIGCPPSMVDDGSSMSYFQQHGFTAVCLVVPDAQTYQKELNTIKSFGMMPIIDVEVPIWNGGQVTSPISNFAGYFQSLKNAGWQYVASEGGRTGDLAYMKNYFAGYVNFNCDQCGLWKDVYKDPFTVANSWESYYNAEWPSIQQGATQAAALGIQNGILAGVWPNSGGDNQILANSLSGSGTTYRSMLDWSYANGVGFTSFHVWCGDAGSLSFYKSVGFESVVANLQTYYPPTSSTGLGWSRVGGQIPLGTGPAVCAQGSNSLDVFARGTNGALYYTSSQGSGWSAWNSLGGSLTSSPAATVRDTNKITVFARGSDGAIWYRDSQNGGASFGNWVSIGGAVAANTGPAVCSWGGGRLDVFVQGTNGALYHKTYTTTSGWSGWESLGGKLTSSPAATSRASGGITVFARGTDGAIWYRDCVGGSWGNWVSIGGQVAANTGPGACSSGSGGLDVFVQGTNGALYHTSYTVGSGWSAWGFLGGGLTSSPAATSPSIGVMDVVVRGGDGAVYEWS